MFNKISIKIASLIIAVVVVFVAGGVVVKEKNPPPLVVNMEEAETVVIETTEPEAPVIEQAEPENQTIIIVVNASAYCPCNRCCGKSDGITATGTKATQGRTIAVDPKVIPYGTEVIINGNTYVAEDCGGAIKGNRIDVYFDTHEAALQFGRQVVTVQYSV